MSTKPFEIGEIVRLTTIGNDVWPQNANKDMYILSYSPDYTSASFIYRLAFLGDSPSNIINWHSVPPCVSYELHHSWLEKSSKIEEPIPEITTKICHCDFVTVILRTGCQCGGK